MRLRCAIALLGLLLVGCDRLHYCGLDVSSTPDQPVFLVGSSPDLSGDGWVYGWNVSSRPYVLGPGDSLAPWHTHWDVYMDPGPRYRVISRVVYGELPAGFHLVSGPESLPAGRLYAFSPSFHGLGSSAYFDIYLDSTGARAIRGLTEAQFDSITRPGR